MIWFANASSFCQKKCARNLGLTKFRHEVDLIRVVKNKHFAIGQH